MLVYLVFFLEIKKEKTISNSDLKLVEKVELGNKKSRVIVSGDGPNKEVTIDNKNIE